MTAPKGTRHRTILEVVRSRPIRTQEELVDALHQRRLDVTQATVSRDIRELGLVRVTDPDGLRYVSGALGTEEAAPTGSRLPGVVRDHVLGVEFVDNVGVVRSRPSTAPLVAAAIDGARLDEVAGTVAGDDTVLIIARGREAALRLQRRLTALMGAT